MRSIPLAAVCLASVLSAQNQGLTLVNDTVAHVDVPYAPTLAPTGGVTAEAWVTYNGALAPGWRYPTVLRMDPSPNQASYFLRIEAGQTQTNRLLWWVSTTNGNFTTSWMFAAGALLTWTHVAGTYDGSTLRLFVNGAQVAQSPASGAILDTGGTFRIGGGDLTVVGGETWNGEIDEVRLWPFARSAAAIASTMNMHLSSMPGEVSTWNLDGNAADSSGANSGAGVGAFAFAANSLVQQLVSFPGELAYGYGSGCHNNALAAVGALANLGNAAFSFVGTRAPAGAPGFLLLSTSSLPVPFPIFGVDVFVDITVGVLAFVPANVLGTGQIDFAIPNDPTLLNFALASQFAWLDGSCATGFSASNEMLSIVVM
ncbi:MAG TPA: LamG domain-containing protein [Planctomycetota bacterium]|nr:LamG domain-containing protein [Planctomycetota bacterium]